MTSSRSQQVARLYDAHARQIWRALVRLGVPAEQVEDTVHDVFVTAYVRLDSFRHEAKVSTWLFGIAVGVAANVRRSLGRRQALVESSPEEACAALHDALVDPGLPPDVRLEQAFAWRELEQVLGRLPGALREVLVLMELEEFTAPQVAEMLELNVNTVYSRLRQARAALSHSLQRAAEKAS